MGYDVVLLSCRSLWYLDIVVTIIIIIIIIIVVVAIAVAVSRGLYYIIIRRNNL